MPVMREIRVHGVSGTPPEGMLDLSSADDVTRVAGDSTTGYWQRTDDGENKLAPWMRPPGRPATGTDWRVEAYSWGALTSGARGSLSRAAWLLLTPFALANIASWARPALAIPPARPATAGEDGPVPTFSPQRWAAVVIRLAGLALTCLLVAGSATVSIDLVAFQCFRGGDLLCPSLPSQLHFLAEPGWEAPARRVSIAAVGPLLVLAMLWFLGRATVQRYEDVPDRSEGTDTRGSEGKPTKTYPHLLETTAMWNGRRRWRWLAAVHLMGGLATVVLLTGWTAAQIGGAWDARATTGLALGTLMALLAVTGVVMASDGPECEGPREPAHLKPPSESFCTAARASSGVAAAATVLYLGWLGVPTEAGTRGEEFVDLDAFAVALVALAVAIGVAVVLGLVMWRDPQHTTWPARVGVAAALLGSAGIGLLMLTNGGQGWYAVVLLGLVVAVVVHRFASGSARLREWGFRGAGPGLFLGGGLFVALLFTTSAIVGVVVWLAGTADLAKLPTTYPVPHLCPEHTGDGGDLDCSTVTATGDVELLDGRLLGPPSAAVVASGRLSVDSLEVEQTAGRAVAVPSLPVTDHVVTLVVESPDGLRLTSTAPGERDTATATLAEREGGVRTVLIRPGVLIEVRDPPHTEVLVIPDAIRSFAAMFPYVVVGSAGIGVAARMRTRRMAPDIAARVEADLHVAATTVPPADLPDALTAKITSDADRYSRIVEPTRGRLVRAMSRSRSNAALARRGETLLAQVALVAGAAMLFAVVHASGALLSPAGERATDATGVLADVAEWSVAAGLYLCVAAAVGLVALGTRVHKDSAFRRPVGVLWDLSCFWPRVAHPFSPPCYAERAVPDLFERLRFATQGSDRALLAGHSLGSFLCVAAILRLQHTYPKVDDSRPLAVDEPGPRAHVALLTYGSQLRYYWGRVFPGAFGPQVLGNTPAAPQPGRPAGRLLLSRYEYPTRGSATTAQTRPSHATSVAEQLGAAAPESSRWINLFRLTDPLGFTVLRDDAGNSDTDDRARPLLDRPVSEVTLSDEGDPTPPDLLGHAGYSRSSDYHQWAWTLAQRVSS